MSNKNEGLNDRLERKKRVQRIKTGLIWFLVTWMLAQMLISITLIAKVYSLQEQIDIITENTIRSQQIDQQEHQTSGDDDTYGSVTKDSSGSNENSLQAKGGAFAKESFASQLRLSAKDAKEADADQVKQAGAAKQSKEKEEDRKVYLTFDDGPSKNTEKILDILDKYQVKATFFLTGREDEQSLKLYQEIHRRGHTIGMHSYTHKYDEIYASTEAFEQDLERIQGRIFETLGFTCSLYRFPGGSSNQVSGLDMKEFIRVLNDRKITYFDWNAECGDASSKFYKAKELVDNVMKEVVKYHTSVVLLHDAENKRNTVKALPKIIEQLLDMDAQILPIDEDTTLVQHVSAESVED